jgi:hypothetical protein
MSDKWRSGPTHLSVQLRHADGREVTEAVMKALRAGGAGTLAPEIRNIGRGLPAVQTSPATTIQNSDHATVVTIAETASRTGVSAASETISDLKTILATRESQLAVQRALADERLMILDQLRATVRALDGGITKAKSKPRWWRKS